MVLVWRVPNMLACVREMYEAYQNGGMTLISEVWAQTEKCWAKVAKMERSGGRVSKSTGNGEITMIIIIIAFAQDMQFILACKRDHNSIKQIPD